MRCGREGEGFGRSPLNQIPYLHGHGVPRQDPRCRPVLGLDVLGRTEPRPGLAPSPRHADSEWLGSRGGVEGHGTGGWMVQEGYMLQTQAFANPQHEIRLPCNPHWRGGDASVLCGLAAEPRAASRHRFLARLGFNSVRPCTTTSSRCPSKRSPFLGNRPGSNLGLT